METTLGGQMTYIVDEEEKDFKDWLSKHVVTNYKSSGAYIDVDGQELEDLINKIAIYHAARVLDVLRDDQPDKNQP